MMDRERGDGNTILLTVIGVATLLVALVGATFAYFSAQITNESTQSMNISTAAPVGLRYIGKDLSILNAIPSATDDSDFTITNPTESAYAQEYDLVLKIDTNEFTTALGNGNTADQTEALKDQLALTINNGTTEPTVAGGATSTMKNLTQNTFNLTDGTSATKTYTLVEKQRIEPGEVHTYTVNLNFKELDIPQNANQGKNFQAHIELANATSVK